MGDGLGRGGVNGVAVRIGAELKGATPDILQRLIPEHARKQNAMLAL